MEDLEELKKYMRILVINMDMQDYRLKNNKATYFRVKKDMQISFIEPSFLFELIYFYNTYKDEKIKKSIEDTLKDIVIEKDKKIKRSANLSLDELQDRLFRSLISNNKYQTVSLAHELMLRDKDMLFDVLYRNSFLSLDENKLIKTYLFEYLMDKIPYNEYILKNLIIYFISSGYGYIDITDDKMLKYFSTNTTKLYQYVYGKKISLVKKYGIKELKFENESKMSTEKEIILENLTKGENNVRY